MRRGVLIAYLVFALMVCGAWQQSGLPMMGSTQAPSGSQLAPVYNAAGTPCDAAGGACTVTMSIASGHLNVLVIPTPGASSYTSYSVTNSHSDVYSNCTLNRDTAGGRGAQLWYVVTGAAITTITLTAVGQTGGDFYVNPLDYTNPAGLTTATILDACAPGPAGGNENVTTFTTGSTGTLANATDLCASYFWTTPGTWSSPSGTQRGSGVFLPTSGNTSFAQDQTTSTTSAVTQTVHINSASYGPGIGACFK